MEKLLNEKWRPFGQVKAKFCENRDLNRFARYEGKVFVREFDLPHDPFQDPEDVSAIRNAYVLMIPKNAEKKPELHFVPRTVLQHTEYPLPRDPATRSAPIVPLILSKKTRVAIGEEEIRNVIRRITYLR